MPDPAKLKSLAVTTRSRREMVHALPIVWDGLRRFGYPRRALIVAFAQAWWGGRIRVDPRWTPPPEPRVVIQGRRAPKSNA